MQIFVYSDESGVFDKEHNDFFVFAGVIYLSKNEKDMASRMYAHVENTVRLTEGISGEVKAAKISNKWKSKIYRSLNNTHKFAAVIRQQRILPNIFEHKKTKQRYLDYAYKIAVKRKLEQLIRNGIINPDDVESIHFYVDEHTTATNGKYELRESLEQEFKIGVFNPKWERFFPPLFPKLKTVELKYSNSASVRLVRAADIVANKVYYLALQDQLDKLIDKNMLIIYLPY